MEATSSGLKGKVRTNDGTPLPTVNITITETSQPGSNKRVTMTNEKGKYQFTNIPAGTYDLTATAPGYGTVNYPDISVRVGETPTINVTMFPSR